MDQKTITVLNWMAFILLMPATIILVWKMVSDKLKGRSISSDMINVGLVMCSTVIGMTRFNISNEMSWLRWMLLVAQLIVIIVLCKRLWTPLKRQLRRSDADVS